LLKKEKNVTIFFPPQLGRPEKQFSDLSLPSKRRRTANLRENFTGEELGFAASMA